MYFCVIRHESKWTNNNSTVIVHHNGDIIFGKNTWYKNIICGVLSDQHLWIFPSRTVIFLLSSITICNKELLRNRKLFFVLSYSDVNWKIGSKSLRKVFCIYSTSSIWSLYPPKSQCTCWWKESKLRCTPVGGRETMNVHEWKIDNMIASYLSDDGTNRW